MTTFRVRGWKLRFRMGQPGATWEGRLSRLHDFSQAQGNVFPGSYSENPSLLFGSETKTIQVVPEGRDHL
jgi:hypothetical protein